VKIKERGKSAGVGDPGMAVAGGGMPPRPMAGNRLPVAPRERKPALAALAVLLILVGALGATVLVMRAGNRIGVVEITATSIPAGQNIGADQITEAMVAQDSSVQYVTWAERGLLLQKYRTAVPVVQGTLLVGAMVTTTQPATAGKLVVGTSLKAGQYPTGLSVGDVVEVLRVGTPDGAGSSGSSLGGSSSSQSENGASTVPGTIIAATATVESASSDGSGNLATSLMVDQSEAPALAQAASAGNIAVVLVPSTN